MINGNGRASGRVVEKDRVDFSSFLNPLGMPVQVARALKVEVPSYDTYPDLSGSGLESALASLEEIDASHIVVTAGANDALMRIVQVVNPHKVLVCSPTYAGFAGALRVAGPKIVHHSLVAREKFDLTTRFIDYIEPDIDVIFLCSPNNPTGRVIPREMLCSILRTADRWGTFVVVDESLLGFADEHSCTSLLDRYKQLVVVKSFTALYAMAGLRAGWCVCGRSDIAAAVSEAGVPWAVSKPALVAAKAALDVPGYLDLTREYVAAERARLEEGLRSLGMFVIPSHSNMILFQGARMLDMPLAERGFDVKACGGFRGLDDSWYCTAVRTREENARLLEAMRACAREGWR